MRKKMFAAVNIVFTPRFVHLTALVRSLDILFNSLNKDVKAPLRLAGDVANVNEKDSPR